MATRSSGRRATASPTRGEDAGHRPHGLPRRQRLEAVHRPRHDAARRAGEARPRRRRQEVPARLQARRTTAARPSPCASSCPTAAASCASRPSATTSTAQPSLEKTVESLNDIPLVHKPGREAQVQQRRHRHRRPGAGEGRGKPFAAYIRETLLEPMGMKRRSFEPTRGGQEAIWRRRSCGRTTAGVPGPDVRARQPRRATSTRPCWTWRQFLSVLFPEGKTPDGKPIIKPRPLEAYNASYAEGRRRSRLRPRLPSERPRRQAARRPRRRGLRLRDRPVGAARRQARRGRAPSRDVRQRASPTASPRWRCDDTRCAVKEKKPLPEITETKPLTPKEARELAGRYEGKAVHRPDRAGRQAAVPLPARRRLPASRCGARASTLIVDDRLSYGHEDRAGRDQTLTIGKGPSTERRRRRSRADRRRSGRG